MTRLKLDPSHTNFTIDVTSPLRWFSLSDGVSWEVYDDQNRSMTDTDPVLGALLALYAHSKYIHIEWLKQAIGKKRLQKALDEGYLIPTQH